MATKIVYHCDKCGKEIQGRVFKVEVRAEYTHLVDWELCKVCIDLYNEQLKDFLEKKEVRVIEGMIPDRKEKRRKLRLKSR